MLKDLGIIKIFWAFEATAEYRIVIPSNYWQYDKVLKKGEKITSWQYVVTFGEPGVHLNCDIMKN